MVDILKIDKDMLVDEGKGKIVIGEDDVLVTIDGNNDFLLEDGALFVEGIEGEPSVKEMIRRINHHHSLPFGYKVVTMDAHCDDHIEFKKFSIHCLLGTQGQKYHKSLIYAYLNAHEILVKGMDINVIGHSVASSPQFVDHIGVLRYRNRKRIFLNGVAFNYCVGDSAMAYSSQLFEVFVIRDATRSVPPPKGEPDVMEQKLKLSGVKFVFSDQLVAE